MTTIARWKKGWGIMGRLFLLGIALGALGIPLNLLLNIPTSAPAASILLPILGFAYLLVVLPLFLPAALEVSGFTTVPLGGGHERRCRKMDHGQENKPPSQQKPER